MINIIEQIFKELDYKVEDIRQNSVSELNDSHSIDGLFVEYSNKAIYQIFDFNKYDNQSNLYKNIMNKQDKYFQYIMKKDFHNIIEKNTSLIIFIEVNNIEQFQEFKDIVHELEEDKYFFKKYVLVYTQEELKDLKVKVDDTEIIQFIHRQIKDTKNFKEFKEQETNNYYSLLLKLMIKIPTLTFNLKEKQDYPNLKEIINDELENNNLLNLNNQLLKIDIEDKEAIDYLLKKVSGSLEGIDKNE